MAKTEIIGKRLYHWTKDGSAGIIKDTIFRRCFWPVSDVPLFPFADGSSGIEVEGPPTPRNIRFPDDTRFLNGTRGDCFFSVNLKKNQDVVKVVEVTKAGVTVEPGKVKDVKYTDTVTVKEDVREVTEIPVPVYKTVKELKVNGNGKVK